MQTRQEREPFPFSGSSRHRRLLNASVQRSDAAYVDDEKNKRGPYEANRPSLPSDQPRGE